MFNYQRLFIWLSAYFLIYPSLSLGTIIPYSYQNAKDFENSSDTRSNLKGSSIQIINGQVFLDEKLQDNLVLEIDRAQKELNKLSKTFPINFTKDIGIVYFHKGNSRWSIKFTFGGLILKTSEEIILSTEQVFRLQECFNKIEWIEIKSKKYATTGGMRQVGPILHS